jgi:hypothetical protein
MNARSGAVSLSQIKITELEGAHHYVGQDGYKARTSLYIAGAAAALIVYNGL